MAIDYDEFRRTTWEQRVALFTALSAADKAELFRSQVSGWLQRHRLELSLPQIELLEEAIQLTVPELYASPTPRDLVERTTDFERRARELLTPAQHLDALTMQW
jgi:transcriptional regulator with XRE-family HTH domain